MHERIENLRPELLCGSDSGAWTINNMISAREELAPPDSLVASFNLIRYSKFISSPFYVFCGIFMVKSRMICEKLKLDPQKIKVES